MIMMTEAKAEANTFYADVDLPGKGSRKILFYSCSDPRFQAGIEKFKKRLMEKLGILFEIPFSHPGGIIEFVNGNGSSELVSSNFRLHYEHHQLDTICFIAHADCSKYKAHGISFDSHKEDQKFHEEELRQAEEKIEQMFPNVKVIKVFARIIPKSNPNGSDSEIVPALIKFKILN